MAVPWRQLDEVQRINRAKHSDDENPTERKTIDRYRRHRVRALRRPVRGRLHADGSRRSRADQYLRPFGCGCARAFGSGGPNADPAKPESVLIAPGVRPMFFSRRRGTSLVSALAGWLFLIGATAALLPVAIIAALPQSDAASA